MSFIDFKTPLTRVIMLLMDVPQIPMINLRTILLDICLKKVEQRLYVVPPMEIHAPEQKMTEFVDPDTKTTTK